MQLRELNTGELFRFVDRDGVYEARGNGWFSTVDGYDGGPWYSQPGTYDLVERLQRRNARFWVWWKDGWVKLTLAPGQSLRVACGGQHEEGWSRYSEQWTHTGDRVEREWASEGQDCDGRSAQYGDDYAMLDELAAVGRGEFEEMLAPHWRDLQASQWDEFAELANY